MSSWAPVLITPASAFVAISEKNRVKLGDGSAERCRGNCRHLSVNDGNQIAQADAMELAEG